MKLAIWAVVAWLSVTSPTFAESSSHTLMEKTSNSVAKIQSIQDKEAPRSEFNGFDLLNKPQAHISWEPQEALDTTPPSFEFSGSDLLKNPQQQISWGTVAGATWYEVRERSFSEKPSFYDRALDVLSKISYMVRNR